MLSIRALILGVSATLGVGLGLVLGAACLAPAALAQSAPACTPAALDNSALQDGAVTISPLPGARDASTQTQISLLGVPAADISSVRVVGAVTGAHTGRLEPYSQGDGASFVPARAFAEGERVSVHAEVRVGGREQSLSDEFAVASEDRIATTPRKIVPGGASEEQSFHSRPELHPPVVSVTAQSAAVASGDVLLAPYGGPGQAGPMILEPDGALVWFKPLPTHTEATNLQVQEYEGKPVLTWWQGNILEHGFGQGEDVIADDTYTDIAHVRAGNGLDADLHEFTLTPRGTALITAYEPVLCDLSSLGGPSYGAVTDSLFQEIDVKTGLVMYEWTSLDHVGLGESYEHASTSSVAWPFDFFHLNSISPAHGGSLLISGRNTWAVYELNEASGQIAWQLGGRHSSFEMGAGTGTAWQHDPRELPDGSLSVFDNGASPKEHDQSRAIVVSLSDPPGEATLSTRITHTPPVLAESQGSVQALPNGDWFVGWGQEPFLSEFSPGGEVLFQAQLPAHDQSYRAFRFPWSGRPAHAPAFVYEPDSAGGAGEGTVYASWNGATEVSAWRVLAGASATGLTQVAQAARSGFETAVTIPTGTTGPLMAVQALGASGEVLATSATESESSLQAG